MIGNAVMIDTMTDGTTAGMIGATTVKIGC
jgi:hypothetical protein